MLTKLNRNYRKDSFLESHRFLLIYAHIIAVIHGIGFLIQGSTRIHGHIKYALIQTDAWHGGLPAISIFNISYLAGVSIIILSIISIFMILFYLKVSISWLGVLIFISGGGFVFLWITFFTFISLFIIKPSIYRKHTVFGKLLMILLAFWLFGSWFLGWMLPDLMKMMSLAIFFIFDLLVPIIIIVIHRHFRKINNMKSNLKYKG